MANFWDWYNKNGLIPNVWKGFLGLKDQEQMNENTLASQENLTNKTLEQQKELYLDEQKWQREQFASQTDFANRQLAENIRQADLNYGLQNEAFQYQKQLNATQMEREDSAMRRQMADLQAAGLSPLAAVGGSGAGSAALSSGAAPQYDMSGINAASGQYLDIARQYASLHQQASQNYMNGRSEVAMKHNSDILGAKVAMSQMRSDMYYKGINLSEQLFNAKVNNDYTKEQKKRLEFENKWYEEHGYQPITLATVVSDFLNKGEIKEAVSKFTDLVGQGLSAVAEGAAAIAESIKNHKGSTIQFTSDENKGMVKDLSKSEYSFVLEYADKINKPYYEWDLDDWLNCAAAEKKSRKK